MSTSTTPPTDHDQPAQNLSSYSHEDLIWRITSLESQLRSTQTQLSSLLSQTQTPRPTIPPRRKREPRPFDASQRSTRFTALKLAYIGSHYNGFEHANNNVTPKPTVEEVLYKALRKTRLISPELSGDADTSTDVVWSPAARSRAYTAGSAQDVGKKKLELNWEGCEYSKCGRTDAGVSAFGQVIALRLRSSKPLEKPGNGETEMDTPNGSADELDDSSTPPWDSIASELPYVALLNSVLPSSIRILAWLPHPPHDFSARFSCRERRYKYFFTNPAFCPTPGSVGMSLAPSSDRPGQLTANGTNDSAKTNLREGWLDIDQMRTAANKLVGLHDFRNLCKIDPSKQMSRCERRITHADIEERPTPGTMWTTSKHLNMTGEEEHPTLASRMGIGSFIEQGPKVYAFTVHGSAFLWHQVRCMMGVLFLVGQGLEKPIVIDDLLDIRTNPGRPMYQMAEDTGLVLWDCVFDTDESKLDWVYAGDQIGMKSLTGKTDGKFGLGSLMDVLWTDWRKAKMEEILAASLVDLAVAQGDGSALERGGFRDPAIAQRTQKIFEGGDGARIQGQYVKVMNKDKMDTLETQNEKYLRTRQVRKDAKKEQNQEATGGD